MAETSTKQIQAVIGPEPNRDGEFPVMHSVGYSSGAMHGKCTKILVREENFGTYSIKWYDVYKDYNNIEQLVCSVNAIHVAQVDYVKA